MSRAGKLRVPATSPDVARHAAKCEDEAGAGSEMTRDSDESSDGEAMCPTRSEASKARKPMRGEPACRGDDKARTSEQLRLLPHLEERQLDSAAKELVMRGILNCEFCGHLSPAECEGICKSMRYFAFCKGDVILQEGEEGGLFFVTQTGQLEVSISGIVSGTLGVGDPFGGISLLFDCPHHANVSAKTAVGVWAVDGKAFRTMLREYAEPHMLENLELLQQLKILEGLSSAQKSTVASTAITETCAAGSLVASTGETPNRLCVVKSGTLCEVTGGSATDSGFSGGKVVRELKPGDCFGEQYFRHGAPSTLQTNLVAMATSELFWVTFGTLAEVLGTQDIAARLETAYAGSVLREVPIIASIPAQLWEDMSSFEFILNSFSPLQKLGILDVIHSVPCIVLVVEGEFLLDSHGSSAVLRRGSWCQDDELVELQNDFLSEASTHGEEASARPRHLVAGPSGARVAILTVHSLTAMFSRQTYVSTGDVPAALDHLRKLLAIRKVMFLRSLAYHQISSLALLMTKSSGWKVGEVVFDQGEHGDKFYIIVRGQVRVDANGVFVRELEKGVGFGEYALLFETARSAKVTVTVAGTEFWSASREVFEQLVDTQMREDLMRRARLHDWTVTLGNLRHIRPIGVGSFGSVRLVEHVNTKVRYALKRIKKKHGKIPQDVEDECALLRVFSHPFLLQMVTTFQTAKSIYILTELLTGGHLYDRLVQVPGGLGRREAQFYVASLALALEALHQASVIYRDLKPENVLLDAHGYVKLVDFGFAKKLTSSQKTYSIVGTCHYMAPEVIRGRGYGAEADFWSLGVMLYELECAQLPFGDDASCEQEVLRAVKEEALKFPKNYSHHACQKIVEALLQKNVSKRLAIWGKVKDNKYFKGTSARPDLFAKLLSRELRPPFVPESETYTDESSLAKKVTFSDAGELSND